MNIALAIEGFCAFIGFILWMFDDPYMPEARMLGSAYGLRMMFFGTIALAVTLIVSLVI